MQGRAGQQASNIGSDAFDVRVVAFSGPRARTLRGLQEIFGIDSATAARLIESLPAIVRRGVPREEAQSYVAALQQLGAQVVLERAAKPAAQRPAAPAPPAQAAARRGPPPPVPRARGGPPPPPPTAAHVAHDDDMPGAFVATPASDLPLPRPLLRPPSADLEFDMLGQADSLANELPSALQANDADFGVGAGEGAAVPKAGARNTRRQELELDTGGSSNSLDLNPAAAAPRVEVHAREPEPVTSDTDAKPTATRTGATRPIRTLEQADPQRGPPMSRAAVVQHAPLTDDRSERSLALLQLLAAVAVGVGGVRLDNSIFYGNASLLSVIVHGLALQQLGYGIWRLLR